MCRQLPDLGPVRTLHGAHRARLSVFQLFGSPELAQPLTMANAIAVQECVYAITRDFRGRIAPEDAPILASLWTTRPVSVHV